MAALRLALPLLGAWCCSCWQLDDDSVLVQNAARVQRHGEEWIAGETFDKFDNGAKKSGMEWDQHASTYALPPNVTEFAKIWQMYQQKEDETDRSNNHERIQLVVGVFARASDQGYREVIRHTWMKQRHVCALEKDSKEQKADCSVHVGFVLGDTLGVEHPGAVMFGDKYKGVQPRKNLAETLKDEKDLHVLGVKENMNEGKTIVWFRHAVKNYPWATHIGKLDTDVYPYWPKILALMPKDPPGCHGYFGAPLSLHDPADCIMEGPRGHGKQMAGFGTENCAYFMNGGLYMMSKGLAADVSAPGSYWDQHSEHSEDCQTGKALHEHTKEKGTCLYTWAGNPTGAWIHVKKWVGGKWSPKSVVWRADQVDRKCMRDGVLRLAISRDGK